MIEIVTKANAYKHSRLLSSFYRLRYEVFVERLGWELDCAEGDERDQFDDEDATYLLLPNRQGETVAGARLIAMDRPGLLNSVFPFLVAGEMPCAPDIWEVTRLVVDHKKDRLEGCGNVCGELLTGLLEFGVLAELSHLVSVSDVRIERILRRAGWTTKRLGAVHRIGNGDVAAEIQEATPEVLAECRRRNGIQGSVFATVENLMEAV
jgi:N-acyl-L-homoserine lactone synthetase